MRECRWEEGPQNGSLIQGCVGVLVSLIVIHCDHFILFVLMILFYEYLLHELQGQINGHLHNPFVNPPVVSHFVGFPSFLQFRIYMFHVFVSLPGL